MSRLLFDWNEIRLETLRTEWRAGKTCSQIAAILGGGITRNAVIGKVHRLNLGRREALNVQPRSPRTRPTEARPKPAEPVQVPNGSFMLSSPMRRNAAAVRPPAPVLAPIQIKVRKVAKGKPCGVLDVTGCKWAVGYDHKTIGGHVFRNEGENAEPVGHKPADFPVDQWQKWASPVWMDINQTNTLNVRMAKEAKDERHLCPLQLDLIERAVIMWSNPGDVVLSPFMGIGSEGYTAAKLKRKFIGVELKESYWQHAVRHIQMAEDQSSDLFDMGAVA